jgi:hypothetical protein
MTPPFPLLAPKKMKRPFLFALSFFPLHHVPIPFFAQETFHPFALSSPSSQDKGNKWPKKKLGLLKAR